MINTKNILKTASLLALVSILPSGIVYSQETSDRYEISQDIVDKVLTTNTISMRRILKEAEKNIQKVNNTILEQQNKGSAKEFLDKGNALYAAGNYQEAKEQWEKAALLSDNPTDIKNHILQTEKIEKLKNTKTETSNS